MRLERFKKFILNEKLSFFDTDSIKVGDFHQAILDVGYDAWNLNKLWSYNDMVEFVKSEYGDKFALLILLGKYNQQVGNGGHVQYFDNGYASVVSSGVGDHKEVEQHEDMIDMFRKTSELFDIPEGKKIYDIMVEFGGVMEEFVSDERCGECDGDGEIEEDCQSCNGDGTILDDCPECGGDGEIEDDDGATEECSNCGGVGEVEIECEECGGTGTISEYCENCDGSGYEEKDSISLSRLDDMYYKIDDWEDILNDFSEKILKDKYPVEMKANKYNL